MKDALGRHAEAIADYGVMIRLNPDNAQAFYNRGVAKTNLGRYEDAIADYDEAIRLKPDYSDALNNRDVLNDALGRHTKATADYKGMTRVDLDNARASYDCGRAIANPAIMKQSGQSWLKRNSHWVTLIGVLLTLIGIIDDIVR